MPFADFFLWLENTAVGTSIRESSWWFPIIETVHVFAIVLVAGSIMIIDLRLMNLTSRKRSVSELIAEVLPITWIAFVLAAITGGLLFSSAAVKYANNWPFRVKMLLLLFAALNMGVFHMITSRSIATWDRTAPPTGAKFAGAASLLIWFCVLAFGRWIGFTI